MTVLAAKALDAFLAATVRWDFAMYSTLAGFVEPGESLEEAVAARSWKRPAYQ